MSLSDTPASTSHKAVLHFFCGKMAAGKSTLSAQLATQSQAILVCEDLWLSQLYPDEIVTFDDYLKYAARLKEVLTPHLTALLRQGSSLVLDFPGNVPAQRRWFRTLFEAAHADHVLHYVEVPDAVCKTQLRRRNEERPPGSKVMTEDEFDHITSFFVPPSPAEGFNVRWHRREHASRFA
jgi:predicted kinase